MQEDSVEEASEIGDEGVKHWSVTVGSLDDEKGCYQKNERIAIVKASDADVKSDLDLDNICAELDQL